jgi:hypothetical protein
VHLPGTACEIDGESDKFRELSWGGGPTALGSGPQYGRALAI